MCLGAAKGDTRHKNDHPRIAGEHEPNGTPSSVAGWHDAVKVGWVCLEMFYYIQASTTHQVPAEQSQDMFLKNNEQQMISLKWMMLLHNISYSWKHPKPNPTQVVSGPKRCGSCRKIFCLEVMQSPRNGTYAFLGSTMTMIHTSINARIWSLVVCWHNGGTKFQKAVQPAGKLKPSLWSYQPLKFWPQGLKVCSFLDSQPQWFSFWTCHSFFGWIPPIFLFAIFGYFWVTTLGEDSRLGAKQVPGHPSRWTQKVVWHNQRDTGCPSGSQSASSTGCRCLNSCWRSGCCPTPDHGHPGMGKWDPVELLEEVEHVWNQHSRLWIREYDSHLHESFFLPNSDSYGG